jgi:hypothetical protein
MDYTLKIKTEDLNQTSRALSLCILIYIMYLVSGVFAHFIFLLCELMYNNIIYSCIGFIVFYFVLNESYRYGDRNPMDDLMMVIFVPLEIICRIIYFIVDPILSFIGLN